MIHYTTIIAGLAVAVTISTYAATLEPSIDNSAVTCAARLLAEPARQSGVDLSDSAARNEWLHVERIPNDQLSLEVFRAQIIVRRPSPTAIFAAGDQCTLINGSLDEILGSNLDAAAVVQFALAQYNNAVVISQRTDRLDDVDPVALANAVLQLASPFSAPRLVGSVDEIPRAQGRREIRRQGNVLRTLRMRIVRPSTRRGRLEFQTVRFFSWDEVGGVLWQNDFVVFGDRRISLSRIVLASKVGAFKPFAAMM